MEWALLLIAWEFSSEKKKTVLQRFSYVGRPVVINVGPLKLSGIVNSVNLD